MSILNKLASFFNRRDKGDLKLFTEVVDDAITTLGKDINLLELEYNLRTATGEWLDEWGSWFGVYRGMNEDDDTYRYRILTSLARATGTIPAILSSVLEYYEVEYGKGKYTEADIKITEPYTMLKKFSECGDFSGVHRFPDGEFYRHHTIEISLPESVTPQLRQMVDKTKAGGVKVYYNVNMSNKPEADGSSGVVSMAPSISPLTDATIGVDMNVATVKYGTVHSTFAPPITRMRSGKKILDSVDGIICTNFDIVTGHTYKDISHFWKIMCKYGHTTPVWVPPVDVPHNVFSEDLGTRSGDRIGHWEYQEVEEVFKDAEDNVLQLPVVHSKSYIRPAMRSRSGNGHSVGYPRSGLQGENFDRNVKEVFTSDTYVDAYWIMKDWSETTIIKTIEVPLTADFELSIEKVFTTEHILDEQEFNVSSRVLRLKDDYRHVTEPSYEDVIDIDVQPRVEYELHTNIEVREQDKLSVISDVTNYIETFTTDRDISAVTHTGDNVNTSENLELVISTKLVDTTTIEMAIFRDELIHLDELEFSTTSSILRMRDAGQYGTDIPFAEVINKVQVQPTTEPTYIKTITHTEDIESLVIHSNTEHSSDITVLEGRGAIVETDTGNDIITSDGVKLASVPVYETTIEMSISKKDYLFLDEVQFNIVSPVTRISDAGMFATDIPLMDAIHLVQVQSTATPTYIKTIMCADNPVKLAIHSDTRHYTEIVSERCIPLSSNGEYILTSYDERLVLRDSLVDMLDIEIDIDKVGYIYMEESIFNMISPVVNFRDAGKYGSDVPLTSTMENVETQLQPSVLSIKSKTMMCSEEDTELTIHSHSSRHTEIMDDVREHFVVNNGQEVIDSDNQIVAIRKVGEPTLEIDITKEE